MKDLKSINAAIASIKTSGARLDQKIQDTAVAVALHFAEHKDTGLVNRLYTALPKGARALALAQWLLNFTAVKPNTDKDTKEANPFVFDRTKVEGITPEVLEKAATTMWYEYRKEKAVDDVYDVQKAFRAMLRHIERSTKVEHFNHEALVTMAKAVGIPESDVPTKPGAKAKAVDTTKEPAATL